MSATLAVIADSRGRSARAGRMPPRNAHCMILTLENGQVRSGRIPLGAA